MSKVNLTINGLAVEAKAGMTILEAAKTVGIDIPTFCHDPELAIVGACRICVVEVSGARNLPAACTTPVGEGMVVQTESERVIRSRKTILNLIWVNHPQDCLVCEKTGSCKLQDYSYKYGVAGSIYKGEKKEIEFDDTNPFFFRDLNKCILCGKCIRKCHDVNGVGAVDFMYRGFATKVTTPFDVPIEESSCVFCGMCVDVCPVGALTPKLGLGQGRSFEVEKVLTTCPYCGCGCTFFLHVRNDKIVGASPSFEGPMNGHLCVKGRFGWDFVDSPDRLTTPLIKKDGEFVEAGWDEALDLVASKFKEVRAQYGAGALAGLSSARCTNEDNYLFQKLLRVLGTNNVDHCARL
jgi:predicted molibdopterin-dependent oxidoreductase YjgC